VETLAQWLDSVVGVGFGSTIRVDLLVHLLLAVFLGGAIGWERQASAKPAGLRTNVLICVGATLLTDLSIGFTAFIPDGGVGDPGRIAAQIVSGIGFLGAGTIIQARGTVTGLTTAATLWVVAAIGMAVGAGFHIEAVGATGLVLIVLIVLERLEKVIARYRGAHLHLTLAPSAGTGEVVEEGLLEMGLRIARRRIEKDAKLRSVILHLWVVGPTDVVRKAQGQLVLSDDITGMRVD